MADELFGLIRNHEYNKFIIQFTKIIKQSPDDLNLNIPVYSNNYLLSYATKFNKPKIVEILLKHNANYDIVNKYDNYIFNEAILEDYYDIVSLFIKYSKINIGPIITQLRDNNNNIPLHIAIKTNNLKIVQLLLFNDSDCNYIDNKGNNALHYACKSGNQEIVKLILPNIKNINYKNKSGETALHISMIHKYDKIALYLLENTYNHDMDVNITDNDNEYTPLSYAVIWNSMDVIKKILENNGDPNIQDSQGNTCLMLAIKENHISIFKYIYYNSQQNKDIHLDYNLWNSKGEILLHLIIKNHKYFNNNIDIVENILLHSNLNLQDIYGYSSLHLLAKSGLFDNYKKCLRKKKLNIFLENHENKFVFDYFYKNDKFSMKQFLDIVSESYLYILKKNKHKWNHEFEKICSRDISVLTDKDYEFLKLNKNNSFKEVSSTCKNIITQKLQNIINNKDKISFCDRSYPMKIKKDECIELVEYPILDICTFVGSLIDILFGLIFLLKKHKNVCSPISIDKSFQCENYPSLGAVNKSLCNYLGFEIIWDGERIKTNIDFDQKLKNCIVENNNFIIIPLGIDLKNKGHSNYLIYDVKKNELERFEPHGNKVPRGFNYNSKLLDSKLKEFFSKRFDKLKYFSPKDFLPKIGFQTMDNYEGNKNKIGDPAGFCALWSIWYVDNRITNSNIDRKKLVNILFENISFKKVSYKNTIRNYSKQIIKIRDDILKKVSISINDWMNDEYTNEQFDELLQLIVQKISNT